MTSNEELPSPNLFSDNKKGDGFPSPVWGCTSVNQTILVAELIELHAVAGHHIFVGEHDHAGCRRISHT